MNGLPYYKAYPRDFIEGTIGMSLELKGAYRIVLDLIYMQGGKLPDNSRYISGLLGCTTRKWDSIREQLLAAGKIHVSGEHLTNKRAVSELETLAKLQDKQRENRARPNKNKTLQSPRCDHTEPDTDRDTNVSLSSAMRFDEFWNAYPHRGGAKKGKAKSKAKYERIVLSGVSEQILISAAIRYGGDRQVVAGYSKDPLTWLNQKGWEDEIEPDRVQRAPVRRGGSAHDSLLAGFGAFAHSEPGGGRQDFGGNHEAFRTGDETMDFGAGGYDAQPVLRLICSG